MNQAGHNNLVFFALLIYPHLRQGLVKLSQNTFSVFLIPINKLLLGSNSTLTIPSMLSVWSSQRGTLIDRYSNSPHLQNSKTFQTVFVRVCKADSPGFIQGMRPLTFRKADWAALSLTPYEKEWKGTVLA